MAKPANIEQFEDCETIEVLSIIMPGGVLTTTTVTTTTFEPHF